MAEGAGRSSTLSGNRLQSPGFIAWLPGNGAPLRHGVVPFETRSMANAIGTTVLLGGFMMLGLGCGGADHSQTVSPADVTGVPAGNAVGTSFSGVYILGNGMLSACDCRMGSCANVHGDMGDTFTLTETDGALRIVEHATLNDSIYNGGIDSNGSFRVGGSVIADKVALYSLLSGVVVAGSSIDAESRNTIVGSIDGDNYDCDVVAKLVLSFLPPS